LVIAAWHAETGKRIADGVERYVKYIKYGGIG
jgi:hypothetical protein